MSTITGFKVAFAGLLVGEQTEEYSKYLTNKSLKALLEKAGAHLSPKVSSCHIFIPYENVTIRDPKVFSPLAPRVQSPG